MSDGDGSFYHRKDTELFPENVSNQFCIGSCYDQDWKYIEELFDFLQIKSKIRRVVQINKINQKESRSSIIRISHRQSVTILGNYLYKNYEIDKIGFPRKYKTFQDIVNNVDSADVRRELANPKISDIQ